MEKHIKDYLLKYNQVQMSGFGIFEVVYKASYIHPILHTFSVPGKYVVFSENKGQDDDFALFVSKKEKISIEEAKNRIGNWVQEIEKTIKEDKKQFSVSTLGSFFINAMGRIEFASVLDTDISPQSFGLEEFTAKLPVDTKGEIEEEAENQRQNVGAYPMRSPEKTKRKKKRAGWWIAASFLLACGIFVGTLYFAFPDTFADYKGKTAEWVDNLKAKFGKTEKIEKIVETVETVETGEAEEMVEIGEQILPDLPLTPSEREGTISAAADLHHYLIIGSFRASENADKFFAEKQATYSNIVNLGIGNSGYYMVGIGPYSQQDAEAKQKEIPNAWVFKK
jgi:nucleoid DNA-binding protein